MTYKEWYEKYVTQPDKDQQAKEKELARTKIEEYNNLIQNLVPIDAAAATETAKNGGRHKGVYRDAMKKREKSLEKSIASRASQVQEHSQKIQLPEKYDTGWGDKDERQKEGLLSKWNKDMMRNAEQAEIEITVWKERFDSD
ncbi:MAG: hypothetical protein LUE61_09205 [Clostridiales bacterium]|nr:hypothetical protein [Clostridiales bacterium]